MKERKKYMSKNGIGLLVLWFVIIVIGAVLASVVPVDYKYITGCHQNKDTEFQKSTIF